jgi:antitoxin MazE
MYSVHKERIMTNAVQKWGNSLGLRIPAAIAAEMQLKRGTSVTLRLEDGELKVRVARPRRRRQSRFILKDLIARMTPENLEPTYDWGPDVGKEIIE